MSTVLWEKMLEAYGLSETGQVRSENQDAFRIIPELGLYLLADGMGGARGGERASKLAVESVTENLTSAVTRDAAALVRAVEVANSQVLGEASRDPRLEGMGTTLVAVLDTGDNTVAIASVGDSRAYLLSGGVLRQITEDQTWIHEVGAPLGLDAEQLRNHPMRHVLTMAIGVSRDVRIHYYAVSVKEGDLILLSSDGLHGVIDDAQIETILRSDGKDASLATRCRSLVGAAHDAGSPDNVTVILIRP